MADPPSVRFVVVGPWRSGTKFVWQSLKDHERITIAPLEITPWPFFTTGVGIFTDGEGDWDLRRDFVRSAFDLLCQRGRTRPTTVLGMKTALRDDLEARDVACGLRQFLGDVRVIVVHRNDLVARFASTWLATSTGRWHVPADADPRAGAVGRLEPIAFRRFVEEARGIEATLALLSRTHQVAIVDYERDIDEAGGLDHAFELLGLEPHGRASPLGRTTRRIEQWVENIDELRAIERAVPRVTAEQAALELDAHDVLLHREENVYFLLGHARFQLRAGRFALAHEQTAAALGRCQGPVTQLQTRALRVIKHAFRGEPDAGLLARSLDRLRERYGACAEFAELEAELALVGKDFGAVRDAIDRARRAGPDVETLLRLDDIERRIR